MEQTDTALEFGEPASYSRPETRLLASMASDPPGGCAFLIFIAGFPIYVGFDALTSGQWSAVVVVAALYGIAALLTRAIGSCRGCRGTRFEYRRVSKRQGVRFTAIWKTCVACGEVGSNHRRCRRCGSGKTLEGSDGIDELASEVRYCAECQRAC